jgi:hypothetical protein
MSWIPLLLAAWILVDVAVVAVVAGLNYRRRRLHATPRLSSAAPVGRTSRHLTS